MINVNQITAQLARMPDNMLQQFAAMHKTDPYTLSLALFESNRRKQMRQGAQMQQQPQPKVVDQEVSQIAQPEQLPEEVGIGQLPAPNMRGMAAGGIVAFDEGGEVPSFQEGGVPKDLEQLILSTAAKYNINPNIAMRLVKQESGFNPLAKSNKGAVGLTQLMPDASKEMGLPPEERTNPAKNLDAGFAYLRKQLDKYGNDYSKALSAYNWGGGNLDKHLSKNEGVINRAGLPKETAAYLTRILPMGAAQAAEPSRDTGLAGLIPGQSYQAPPKAPEGGFLSSESFQRGATSMGLPQDVGRQAYTTLMAPTPLAPASMVPKTGPGIVGGLEKLGEKLYGKFAPGKNMTEAQIAAAKAEMATAARTGGQEQRLLTGPQAKLAGPTTPVTSAGQGITDLVAPGARMVPVAEDASRLEKLAEASNLEKLRKAQEAVGESAAAAQPTQTAARFAQEAGPASAAERIQAASIAREAEHAAQVGAAANRGQAAKTGLATIAAGSTALGNMGPGAGGLPDMTKAMNADEESRVIQQALPEMAPKDIEKIGKEATPKSERKGMSGEDFLMIGLGILSGKSQYALENIGEGGLKGLQMVQAARKNEAEAAYRDAMSKYYAAGTEAIERGAKDKDLIGAAEKAAHDAFTALAKDNVLLMTNPEERAKLYNRLRAEKYAQYGISPTMIGGMGNKYSPADMALVDKYAKT